MSEQISFLDQDQKQEYSSERAILDQLLDDTRLYRSGKDYMELLDFISRLNRFAPFNALLLHLQKPGLTYAASAYDWQTRFNRQPKPDARPLLILWPFGPVALVYDVQDTEGDPLPEEAMAFPTEGNMQPEKLYGFLHLLEKHGIQHHFFDGGDGKAGSIQTKNSPTPEMNGAKAVQGQYLMSLNQNHPTHTQFCTLAHEMGHLLLGHLGFDQALKIPSERHNLPPNQKEIEAESFAYLICRRQGINPKPYSYLHQFVEQNTDAKGLDIYQIMKAVGRLESMLNLTAHTKLN